MFGDEFDDDLDGEFDDEYEFEVLDDSEKVVQWLALIEQIEGLSYTTTLKQAYKLLQTLRSQQINHVLYLACNDTPEALKAKLVEAVEGHSAVLICDLSPYEGFVWEWILPDLDYRGFEMGWISPDDENWDGMELTLVCSRRSLLPEVVEIEVVEESGQISFIVWKATQPPVSRGTLKKGRLCQGYRLQNSRLLFANGLSLESELFLYEAAGELLAQM